MKQIIFIIDLKMFKQEKKTLFFILNRSNLKKRFFIKNKDVFTLNKYVLNDEERKKINHFYPDPNKTAFEAEFLMKQTIKEKEYLIKEISKIKYFKRISYIDELIDNFLEAKLSIYHYLESVIPYYKEYILINNNRKHRFNSKIDLILNIEKLTSSKGKILYLNHKFSKPFNPYLSNILMGIQSILIKSLSNSNKKDIYLFSDKKAYFIDYLKSRFLKNNNNIAISYHPTSSYLRVFQIILDQIYKCFINKNFREFSVFLLPTNNQRKVEEIPSNENLKIESLEKNFSRKIFKDTYIFLLNYMYFYKYLMDCFKKYKITNSFFHSIRYPDLFSLSNALSNLNNEVSLISHGSHTKQEKGGLDFFASKNIGLGLCYSENKKIKSLSQSIYCDEFLDSINKKYKRINFLISKKVKVHKNNSTNYSAKTKILLIGSTKPLGHRRYYYESSSEFIGSLYKIYKKLFKHRHKLEICLNIRDVDNEINDQILNNALKEFKKLIIIKKNINLKNELENCDCIISYCSTVLEEGLQVNKPVMCFGLPNYNHFKSYEKKDNSHINDNLKLIEKELNGKFIIKNDLKREIDYIF